MDADGAGAVEAEVLVEGDGAGVVLGDVEEAPLAAGGVVAEEMVDEACGVSAAGVGGMGADGADLDEAGTAKRSPAMAMSWPSISMPK